jgi:lysyl-tRNA synthetase class 2
MTELIAERTGLDVLADPLERLRARLEERRIEIPPYAGRGHLIEAIFDAEVQPHLVQPTFVLDHPREISPLAKAHRDHPDLLVERFELMIGGGEFANAFSELNDPIDQRRRFEDQARLRTLGDEEAQVLDEDFLRAIENGMPPAAGVGIGVDRLVMLLSGAPTLRDVLLFPHMRPEEGRGAEATEEGEDGTDGKVRRDGKDGEDGEEGEETGARG